MVAIIVLPAYKGTRKPCPLDIATTYPKSARGKGAKGESNPIGAVDLAIIDPNGDTNPRK